MLLYDSMINVEFSQPDRSQCYGFPTFQVQRDIPSEPQEVLSCIDDPRREHFSMSQPIDSIQIPGAFMSKNLQFCD